MDIEKLSEAVEQAQGVEVTVDGTTLTASCEAEQGEALALFVPYDTGFTAMVNGQAADIQRLDDTFMAVSLQEGESYCPPLHSQRIFRRADSFRCRVTAVDRIMYLVQ